MARPSPRRWPPNDLIAQFGGPAWTLDEETGQYWYHSFLPGQPDLDWRNPAVRVAMLDNLRFWFDRGVDGFRVDVLWMIAKDDAPWRDGPVADAPSGFGGDPRNTLEHGDGPAMDELLRALRDVADEYPDRVLIGEVYMEPRRVVRYYGPGGHGAHLPFNTALITLPWEARAIRTAIETYEAALPGGAWPNWVLGNHDQSRVATRLGAAQARVAAMLLLTLRGTPTLYYGDELGLPDVAVPPDRVVDVAGRDPERSPMPWTTGTNAGFTDGEPWLPITNDPGMFSVEAQERAPRSMLALHRRLLALRRAELALSLGSWAGLDAPAGVIAYEREHGGTRFLVLLNLTGHPASAVLDGAWTIELSTGLRPGAGRAGGLHRGVARGRGADPAVSDPPVTLDLFLRGLAIGFAIAFALGPIGLLVIRRTVDRGWFYGFLSGVAVATADASTARLPPSASRPSPSSWWVSTGPSGSSAAPSW